MSSMLGTETNTRIEVKVDSSWLLWLLKLITTILICNFQKVQILASENSQAICDEEEVQNSAIWGGHHFDSLNQNFKLTEDFGNIYMCTKQ